MLFFRKKLPDGTPRENMADATIDNFDKWYQQECTWVAGYVSILERHLSDLKQRCEQCPYRNQEGSGCNEKVSD